jgi:hypothetical protein
MALMETLREHCGNLSLPNEESTVEACHFPLGQGTTSKNVTSGLSLTLVTQALISAKQGDEKMVPN